MPDQMTQTAPDPTTLRELVEECSYRPTWSVDLYDDYDRGEGCRGLTLAISALVEDSVGGVYPGVDRGDRIRIQHLFPVPAAFYDRDSWARWLFDRFTDVERHEAAEFFRLDGDRVFAPHHGRGEDPYIVWQLGTAERAGKRAGET